MINKSLSSGSNLKPNCPTPEHGSWANILETEMNKNTFMDHNNTGLILRAFSKKESDVPGRIAMLDETVDAANKLQVDEKPLIAKILILVWRNEDAFPGEGSCGLLAKTATEHFADNDMVSVREVTRGDLFCGILNAGVMRLAKAGCSHAIISSAEAASYWNPELAETFVDAFCDGALVAGLAINELTESILEGRIANTFAMWNIEALMTVGGFDLRAAKPAEGDVKVMAEGWDDDGGFHQYHLAGCEEMIPLSRLIDFNVRDGEKRPCIAPILPTGEGERYVMPDPNEDPELYKRHKDKFGTKTERQFAHLVHVGADFRKLRGGVMPEYRHF